MSGFEDFWAIYGNLVLTLGTNSLLALSIWLTLCLRHAGHGQRCLHGHRRLRGRPAHHELRRLLLTALAGGMAAPAIVAAVIGLPTIRLSGVYLAMATLGFGEVVRVFILNTESVTGGLGAPPVTCSVLKVAHRSPKPSACMARPTVGNPVIGTETSAADALERRASPVHAGNA